MGFWNRGSEEKAAPAATDFTSPDDAGFSSGPGMSSLPPSGGGGNAAADMQRFSLALREQMMVQQAISELCDAAFEKCLGSSKPAESLRGSDVACIHATVGKWMDTNDFMQGRLAKKQQNSQTQQFS